LYWEDILYGRDAWFAPIADHIVCAGHIMDYCFLPRLRSIIELSDGVLLNEAGSAMFYALALGKPTSIVSNNVRLELSDTHEVNSLEQIAHLRVPFSEYTDTITDAQQASIRKFCAPDSVLSPTDMKEVFTKNESLYLEMIQNGEIKRPAKKLYFFPYAIRNGRKCEILTRFGQFKRLLKWPFRFLNRYWKRQYYQRKANAH
jgi:hypothetical protein